MCGIVGIVAKALPDIVQRVLAGLRALEYRGYDSAGYAVPDAAGTSFHVKRHIRAASGATPVDVLDSDVGSDPAIAGATLALGHTRWATHGEVAVRNAHPHLSDDGRVIVVHNGIIENADAIRESLQAQGVVFKSETDTEVVPQLIAAKIRSGIPGRQAVTESIAEWKGLYALTIALVDDPDTLYAARRGSPLCIAYGDGWTAATSDVLAAARWTNRFHILQEGEICKITADGARLSRHDGTRIIPRIETIDVDASAIDKGGYPHFMLKEIHEGPATIEATIAAHLQATAANGERIVLPNVEHLSGWLTRIKKAVLVACGTSYHSCLVGKFFIEKFARIPCDVDVASEYQYRQPVLDDETLVIAVSQSGETADTKAALEMALDRGALTITICSVPSSAMPRIAHGAIFAKGSREIGVAATKTYLAQLTCHALFALWWGRLRGTLRETARRIDELRSTPGHVAQALTRLDAARDWAKDYYAKSNFLFLGRRYNFPTAFEAALKLKEVSYVHAEAYGAGEMKHGPIALIDKDLPVVVIAPRSNLSDKLYSNVQEVATRKGDLLIVGSDDGPHLRKLSNAYLEVPAGPEWLSPLVTIVPLQAFAYHVGVFRGCDPDKPRNLAKTVTVE
jgi:glucosamine--fructose-6-phosphate aminotransferase (isomerizing)